MDKSLWSTGQQQHKKTWKLCIILPSSVTGHCSIWRSGNTNFGNPDPVCLGLKRQRSVSHGHLSHTLIIGWNARNCWILMLTAKLWQREMEVHICQKQKGRQDATMVVLCLDTPTLLHWLSIPWHLLLQTELLFKLWLCKGRKVLLKEKKAMFQDCRCPSLYFVYYSL